MTDRDGATMEVCMEVRSKKVGVLHALGKRAQLLSSFAEEGLRPNEFPPKHRVSENLLTPFAEA